MTKVEDEDDQTFASKKKRTTARKDGNKCVCKNSLSVKHTLLECPVTTVISEKIRYDLNASNIV